MKPLILADSSMALLTKSLDLRSINQQVITANIANAETPGYSPARFQFEEQLKEAVKKSAIPMSTTNSRHISPGASSIEAVHGTVVRTYDNSGIGDKNGVSVDEEMIELSKNQLMYETAAQLLKKKLTLLKYVVQDGQ